jgi:hypothetical protein
MFIPMMHRDCNVLLSQCTSADFQGPIRLHPKDDLARGWTSFGSELLVPWSATRKRARLEVSISCCPLPQEQHMLWLILGALLRRLLWNCRRCRQVEADGAVQVS